MKAHTSTQPIQQPQQNEEDSSMLADTSFTNASHRESLMYQMPGQTAQDRFSMPQNCFKYSTLNHIIETPKSHLNGNNVQQDNDFFDATSNASFVFEHSKTQRERKMSSPKADDEQTFELNGQTYLIDFDEYSSASSPREKLFERQLQQYQDINRQISPIIKQQSSLQGKNEEDYDLQIYTSPRQKEVRPLELCIQTSPQQHEKLKANNKQMSQQILLLNNSLLESQNPNITELVKNAFQAHNYQEFYAVRRQMTMGGTTKQNVGFNMLELTRIESERKLLEVQLVETQKQLQHLNSMYIHQDNVADAKLHLAFLFASPLVMRCQGNGKSDTFKPMPQLEFKREFKEITNSIKETNRKIRIKSMQATVEHLTMILSQKPLALHFSGHGIENTPQFFGRDWHLKKDEGNFLLFETDDGEGELVSQRKLSEFISQSKTNLEFVFVASCNSEPVGRIFLNAGAKHVICVKNGQQILDGAVITFSKSFYSSVFSQTISICDAFKIAQNQVEIKFSKGEANKFSMLTSEESMPVSFSMPSRPGMPQIDPDFLLDDDLIGFGLDEGHKCKLFGPLKEGQLESLDTIPKFKEYPAKVDNYIGRQIEQHNIVKSVLQNRLVNVIGLPGIGKTSIAKNVIHYILERKLFKAGIIFLSLKGFINCELFLKQLITFVKENFELDEEQTENLNHGDIKDLIKISLNFLKNLSENLIIVFDNVEDLLYNDKLAFRNLVNDLLNRCPLLHVLMTSRTTLGALQDIQEKIVVLQELNVNYTVKLFISRSRDIPEEELNELLEVFPDNTLSKDQKAATSINEHHLFKLLGGNPHAIILAAPILIKMKLKELYQLLNSKEMHDVLKVDGITDSTVASLRLSLEASLKILEKEDKNCLRFFFFIGMLPGGVYEEDLEDMWKDNWKQYVELLLNLSLVQKKEQEQDKKKNKYILPPFMNNYAEAKISDEDKLSFQNIISKYYAKLCKNIFIKNGKAFRKKKAIRQSELNHQLMEKLLKHETNIWACINRLIEGHVQLEKETEFQENDEEEDKRIQRFSDLLNKGKSLARTFTVKFDKAADATNEDQESSDQLRSQMLPNFARRYQNQDSLSKEDISTPLITQKAVKILSHKDQALIHKKKSMITSKDQNSEGGLESINELSESVSSSSSDNEGIAYKYFGNDEQNERKLEDIIRHSVINFQRPSSSTIKLSAMKNSEIGKKTLFKATTTCPSSLPKLNTRKESTQRIEELHSLEKLVIYYAMNLFLLNEVDSAEHLITKYGLKIKGCQLFEANLQRILGLIYSKKKEKGEQVITYFEKALGLYRDNDCYYGQAISNFSIGFFYRSKINDFIIDNDEDYILNKSKEHLEAALNQYYKVNHLIGQALCHKQLLMVVTKLNQKDLIKVHTFQSRELSKYISNYKNSPFILRVHGNEMSLMFEVVTNNDNNDLFSKVHLIKKGGSYDNYQVQIVSQVPQLLPQQSTPVEQEQQEDLRNPNVKHYRNSSAKMDTHTMQKEEMKEQQTQVSPNTKREKAKVLFKIASNLEVVEEEDSEAPILPINSTPVKEASSDRITDFLKPQGSQFAQSRNKGLTFSQTQPALEKHQSPSLFDDANVNEIEDYKSKQPSYSKEFVDVIAYKL